MNFWINTVSHDHVKVGVAGGFTQANHGSRRNLQRMARGDLIVFYSSKTSLKNGTPLQTFTAIGRVIDNVPYQFEMSPDFKPFRRNVAFFDCEQAPIRPLIDHLEFIPNKQRWGFPFRRGLFKIGQRDFERIAAAMGVEI